MDRLVQRLPVTVARLLVPLALTELLEGGVVNGSGGVSTHKSATGAIQAVLTFVALVGAAVIAGCGMIAGGLSVLADQWINKNSNGGMQGRHTAAVVVIFFGIAASVLLGGLAVVYLGVLRRLAAARWDDDVQQKSAAATAAVAAAGPCSSQVQQRALRVLRPRAAANAACWVPPALAWLAVAALLAAVWAGLPPVLQTSRFWQVSYDQLRFFCGMLAIVCLTYLTAGVAAVAMAWSQWSWPAAACVGPAAAAAAVTHPLQPYRWRYRWRVVTAAAVFLSALLLITTLFQALWNSTRIATYWARHPAVTASLLQVYLVNDGDAAAMTFALPAGAAASLVKLGGAVYAKLYVDVLVYYAFLLTVLGVGAAGTAIKPVRRWLHHRVPVHNAWAARLWPCGVARGELLLCTATVGLYGWWLWWWSVGFPNTAAQLGAGALADPHNAAAVAARTLGHLATLTMSFLLFPVTRNSVWEAAFGVPFDRAVAYHRVLGRLAWACVTAHMLVWQAKWALEGTLLNNVVTTNNLVIGPGAGNTRTDNFTIPIAELGWLLMTSFIAVALFCRRRSYELFQYTHHAAWLFFLCALVHAWAHWYFVVGGLTLYALDKVARMVNAATHVVTPLSIMPHTAAGLTELVLDARVFAATRALFGCGGTLGGHLAGQFAFVCIPAIGALEWHPLTVSSAPAACAGGVVVGPETAAGARDGTVTFHVRNMGPGTWSDRLAQLAMAVVATSSSAAEGHQSQRLQQPRLRDVAVSIDGPYGRPGRYLEASTLVLVAGGIGITPLASILADLLLRAHASPAASLSAAGCPESGSGGSSPAAAALTGALRRVHLIWAARSRHLFAPFSRLLGQFAAEASADAAAGAASKGVPEAATLTVGGVFFSVRLFETGAGGDGSNSPDATPGSNSVSSAASTAAATTPEPNSPGVTADVPTPPLAPTPSAAGPVAVSIDAVTSAGAGAPSPAATSPIRGAASGSCGPLRLGGPIEAAAAGPEVDTAAAAGSAQQLLAATQRLPVTRGRPDLAALLGAFAAGATSEPAADGGSGASYAPPAAVMVCGPASLAHHASQLAFSHGFDFHASAFAF